MITLSQLSSTNLPITGSYIFPVSCKLHIFFRLFANFYYTTNRGRGQELGMESLCQVFVGTFFVFRNSVEKLCVSWALSLVECVAVWALKLPVPHTDILKTHSSQSFSTELLESKGTGSEHLSQTRHSKLSFSLSYKRIPKCLSGCGCCCIY